jgi:predicted outer membrane protein
MQKKVYLVLLLVVALAVVVSSLSPARNAAAQPNIQNTPACREAADQLVGNLAQLPRVTNLIREICDFRVRVNDVPSNVSELDRLFIESAITGNMLEIQSLEIALENTTNEEWRGLINAMIIMHTSDLEMALRVAEKIGADTTPDFSNARVYPQTPAYDLGKRRIDLEARFLEPLMNAAGPGATPTVVPTDGTVTPTGEPTEVPTETSTVTATSSPSASLGRFVGLLQTPIPTDTATTTATATETATSLPTDTATATNTATETATTLPTDTATATQTATALPTDTSTATQTATPATTATATGSPTVVPSVTPGPGTDVNFDLLALEIIEDEHMMSIETALVAQRLVRNDEIRAFAKHAADMAHLHVMLIDDLKYRLAFNITLPPPRFQEDYQSPRRFMP